MVSFTPAPRNLALGIYCVNNTSGNSSAADHAVADVVNAYPLLETQAKTAIGAKVWADHVSPLISIA
jgi:hypothetical protein